MTEHPQTRPCASGQPQRPSRVGIVPSFGLVIAVTSYMAMWFIRLGASFGNARADDSATLVVLGVGIVATVAGMITGLPRLDSEHDRPAVRLASGLLGVLNFVAAVVLIREFAAAYHLRF